MLTAHQCEVTAYWDGQEGMLVCAPCFEGTVPPGEYETPTRLLIELWRKGMHLPPACKPLIRYVVDDEFGDVVHDTGEYIDPTCEVCGRVID